MFDNDFVIAKSFNNYTYKIDDALAKKPLTKA